MATIILTNRTTGTRTLEKPRHGHSCNGCGYCCATEVCALGRKYIVTVDDDHEGACPALEFEGDRFWCGLVRHAGRYMGLPNDWADPVLGSMIAEALGAGRGCDASDP